LKQKTGEIINTMSRDAGIVQRLIAFLKKPAALEYNGREPVQNPYDDFEPQTGREPEEPPQPVPAACAEPEPEIPLVTGTGHLPGHGSRLDSLVMRALQQFHAPLGFVIRYDPDGRMHYCTGRNFQGRYLEYTEVSPDRRALFLALDTGQSQLFVQADGDSPTAVLCGPLWIGGQVIGLLYLDNPARSRLHRGVFDLFCEQAARLLTEVSE
jgi:hypothetical protein